MPVAIFTIRQKSTDFHNFRQGNRKISHENGTTATKNSE